MGDEEGGEPPLPPPAEGEEGGAPPEEEGMAPASDEEAGDIPIEGFDYEAEKRLILELRRQGRMNEAKRIMQKWADRLGKSLNPDSRAFHSGFQHLLECNELDGLSADKPTSHAESNGKPSPIYNPNKDNGLLVEWSVDEAERDSAIQEVYNVLMAEEAPISDSEDADVITEEDLPVSVSRP